MRRVGGLADGLIEFLDTVPSWLFWLVPNPMNSSNTPHVVGDYDRLGADKTDPHGQEFLRAMCETRDRVMTERLLAHANEHPVRTVFAVVGSLHLPGDGGILARMEEAGWELQRLPGRLGDDARQLVQQTILEKARRVLRAARIDPEDG